LPAPGPFADRVAELGGTTRFFGANQLSSETKPFWEVLPYCFTIRRAVRVLAESVTARWPDLIYVTGPRYLPAAAWIASKHNLPLLFHAHNRLLQSSALKVVGLSLRRCHSQVIACCHYVAQSLRAVVAPSRIRVVYSGTADLQNSHARPARRIRAIGVVGRIAPEKGQLQFVRALKLVGKAAERFQLLIVGSSAGTNERYYKALQHESRDLKVTFTGWQDDLRTVLHELDLLVVPSLSYDAAPRVILEAFSASVPVLANPSGGIPELVDDNVNGFLTRGITPNLIAQRMDEITRLSTCELQCVITRARQRWMRQFRIDRYRNDIWSAMLSLCPSR
jgi:glycosyltransferase involved in cell wall biosynthesis